jgi:hypothetical protein
MRRASTSTGDRQEREGSDGEQKSPPRFPHSQDRGDDTKHENDWQRSVWKCRPAVPRCIERTGENAEHAFDVA